MLLALWLALAVLLAFPSASRADDASQRAGDRCAVLLVLGDDVPSEEARRNLFDACVLGSVPPAADAHSLAADLSRLEFRGHWPIAEVREAFGLDALRTLLSAQSAPASDDWSAADSKALAALLAKPCVTALLAKLASDPAGPRGPDRGELVTACQMKRGPPALPELDKLLHGRVLWTVFTRAPLERVSFDTAGSVSLHFDSQPIDDQALAQAARGFSIQLPGFGAHLALVPEGSLVTTTASARVEDPRAGYGPAHRVDVASSDFGFALKLAPLDSLSCLDIRVDLNANEQYAILVDGHRLARDDPRPSRPGTTTAFGRFCVEPERTHRLHVVRLHSQVSGTELPPVVLVDQVLLAEQLKSGGERVPIHFDLARSKQITMLLTVGAMCEDAGLDPEIVRQQLTSFMQARFGERFVDPQQLAVMVGAVKGFASDAHAPVAGDGSRGALDFIGLLETLSARQLHRGFDSILDARLVCSKRADNKAWDYSFAATAHRPGAKSVGPYALTTSDPTELADIIREPIARMGRALGEMTHGGPYARMVGVPERAVSYRETRLLTTASPDISGKQAAVQLQAMKLDGQLGRVVCDGISAYRQLRSASFTSSDRQRTRVASSQQFEATERADDDPSAFLLPNDGPGPYLLRVGISPPAGAASAQPADSAYRCVTVYEPDQQFWGAALGGYELATFSPGVRDEVGYRTSFLLGYRVPRARLRFGIGLGYSLAWRKLRALPSWDDLVAIPSSTAKKLDANGELELAWRRHALLLFPSLEYRLPGVGRFRPFVRGLLMLDAAVLAGSIPAGLGHFDAGSGMDFDLDAQVFLGSEFQLTDRYALILLLGAGSYAIDDAIAASPRLRSYDATFELSLGLGLML